MEITALFIRDLDRLINEIDLYSKEEDLWVLKDGISNTAGNLALHLCGNLQHFIGAVLGDSDYVRQRANEFADKNVKAAEIKALIETTKEVVKNTLDNLSGKELNSAYPHEVFGHNMTAGYFIHHLYGHLNYHLGQINYHRRLLSA